MSYTKGPWVVKEGFISGELDIVPCFDGPPVVGDWAEVCTVKDYQDDPQANARLIAAAPELLEALEELRKWQAPCGVSEDIDLVLRKADATIAKAKGE